MKQVIVSVGAFFLIGSTAAASMLQPNYPQAQQDIVEAGMRIVIGHPQADWTGMGGPDEPVEMEVPASAMAASIVLVPKDETLPRMETSRTHPAEAKDKDAMESRSDDRSDQRRSKRDGRTAEQMRSGSAWAQHGGMTGYQGMGGPEGDEDLRVYPPCRGRGDDRCQQGR